VAPLKQASVDTVILGCTHYPLITPMLRRLLGPQVTLINSAEETAREVGEILARKGIGNTPGVRAITGSWPAVTLTNSRRWALGSCSCPSGGDTTVNASSRPGMRSPLEMRPLKITPDFVGTADGSVFMELGGTRVLCSAQVVAGVPAWRRGSGLGGSRLSIRCCLAPPGADASRGGRAGRMDVPSRYSASSGGACGSD